MKNNDIDFTYWNNIKILQYWQKISQEQDFQRIIYFLEHCKCSHFKKPSSLQFHLNNTLKVSCTKGNLEIVQYLFTHKRYGKYLDICATNQTAFALSCIHNHVELVRYFLTSPLLKKHPNIYYSDCDYIKEASLKQQKELLYYLINDYQIVLTKEIQNFTSDGRHQELLQLFHLRELRKNLQEELCTDLVVGIKKRKI